MAKPGIPRAHTRDEILDIAQEMLDENGASDLSVRALAKRLQLSPMGLYTYFSSRDDILTAVLNRFAIALELHPIPGEKWDDTIRRITNNLLVIVRNHPQTMNVNYDLRNAWAREQYSAMYAIHKDQGIPEQIYTHIYCGISSFLAGFFIGRMQRATLLKQIEKEQREPTAWENIAITSYTQESYEKSIEALLNIIRTIASPDPCDWRTPKNPDEWTWHNPNTETLQ